ncbi:pyruvate kinase [Flavonifractor hominis]|uniref:Pyruvate kinase n=1 Tax=Flavonifractor hominis TaxID=3133178 RepID=A0ABV1EPF2_9FIRM
MRKTKVICTLGPAVDNEETMRKLILAGMNAARFNFSHGSHEEQLARLTMLKRVRDELGAPVATILDTKGPEIRIKTFANGPVALEKGQSFMLSTDEVVGDATQVSVTYQNLHAEVGPGCRILVDDGLIELLVEKVEGHNIHCVVENGGPLSNNKSINIPDVNILLPSLTEKDKADLKFAAENDFDFIAASFVRKAQDVEDIRAELHKYGADDIRIISKIENREGVNNLDAIIAASDGIMVARGDLGVEIPAHEVPVLQKKMIKATIRQGKPVITATQMLDSMIRNPRPTRAEVSDVANAVFDGTSCVMLSGETASGKYPIEALETMVDTVTAAEDAINYWGRFRERNLLTSASTVSDAITHSCCLTAMDLNATAILAATKSGYTAKVISRFRPACPIVALCQTESTRRQLAISWGVYPYLSGQVDSTDRMFSLAVEVARKEGAIKAGDTVVITAGVPIGKSGTTNLIKAQTVEEVL